MPCSKSGSQRSPSQISSLSLASFSTKPNFRISVFRASIRSVSLIFRVESPLKWKGMPLAAQVTTNVCARSGELMKSYSSFGTHRPFFATVTVWGIPTFFVSNLFFTPSRLKMYLVTESPCFEPSISPDSLISAS